MIDFQGYFITICKHYYSSENRTEELINLFDSADQSNQPTKKQLHKQQKVFMNLNRKSYEIELKFNQKATTIILLQQSNWNQNVYLIYLRN